MYHQAKQQHEGIYWTTQLHGQILLSFRSDEAAGGGWRSGVLSSDADCGCTASVVEDAAGLAVGSTEGSAAGGAGAEVDEDA